MSTIKVAILGLNRVGLSVGLALKRYNSGKGAKHQFHITGADTAPLPEGIEKRGAVDVVARNLMGVVRDKDIVVLALPYSAVAAAYQVLSRDLRAGAVVIDLSPLKLPSLQWAAENLPEHAYMVGVTPVLNPAYLFDGRDDADHAHADLFDKGSWLLMPSPRSPKDAVELASDFGTVLGAAPLFVDPAEHDALVGATEGLPAILGLGTFYLMTQRKVWDDAQRVTNPSFGRLTHQLVDTHPDDLRDMLLNNRQNVIHYLDSLLPVLQSLRTVLAQNDKEALEAALIESAQTYDQWLRRRTSGKWEDQKEEPSRSGGLMGNLMGGYLSGKLRGDRDDKE